MGVASGHSGGSPLWVCPGYTQLEARDYLLGGLRPAAGWCGEGVAWRWRDLPAFPGLFIPPPLSVLPKRIVEEIPSSDIPNNGEVAPDEVNWGHTPSTTTFQSPSPQSPTTENILKGRLVGMMIWGFVVLLAGIATV